MEERRRKILQELEEKGKVRVNELSAELGCSEVTIRNDIKCMERAGLLIRTHGGALKIEENPQKKYSAESIYRNTDKKRAIAACAYAVSYTHLDVYKRQSPGTAHGLYRPLFLSSG